MSNAGEPLFYFQCQTLSDQQGIKNVNIGSASILVQHFHCGLNKQICFCLCH